MTRFWAREGKGEGGLLTVIVTSSTLRESKIPIGAVNNSVNSVVVCVVLRRCTDHHSSNVWELLIVFIHMECFLVHFRSGFAYESPSYLELLEDINIAFGSQWNN